MSPLTAAWLAALAVLLALPAVAAGAVAAIESLAGSLRRARAARRAPVRQPDPYRQALRLARHGCPAGTVSWPR